MYQVTTITSDPLQQQVLVLPDGSLLTFTMRYAPQVYGWFMSFTYGDFVINNVRITVSPNILHQFRNQLPFGINCFSASVSREPTQQQDFSSQLFQLNIIDATEVQEFADYLSGVTT